MKRIFIYLVLLFSFPVMAYSDWYIDGSYHSSDYWYYVDQPRYVGDSYNTDFDDMEQREKSGKEYSTPKTFYINAYNVEDAENKLESALEYAPLSIVISFTNRKEANQFYEKFRDWRINKINIDCIIHAVWTRTDNLFSIGKSGKSVIITIDRYSEGWLAYVDTSPTIRVFDDINLSRQLLEFRKLWIDNIKGTDAEIVDQLQKFVSGYAEYDDEESIRMQNNGFYVEDEVAHSIRGFIEKRKAVCDGYTSAMQFVLACHGIKSFDVIMEGKVDNHSVCMVKVDNEWINVDITGCSGEYRTLKWINEIYSG